MLAAVDSQRSIREIAEHQNLVLLDACLAVAALIDQRLVRLLPPRAGAQSAQPAGRSSLFAPKTAAAEPAPATPAEPAAPNGFLERLLAEARAKEQQRPDLTDEASQERKQSSSYRYVDDRR